MRPSCYRRTTRPPAVRAPGAIAFVIALGACDAPFEPDEGPISAPSRRVVSASSVIDIGMPSGTVAARAFGVAPSGQVVGYADGAGGVPRAFRWTSDLGFRELPPAAGDVGAYAFAINSSGRVVGATVDAAGNVRAARWTGVSAPVIMAALPGGVQAVALAANESGYAAGISIDGAGVTTGFFWNNGNTSSIGTLTGGTYSYASGINESIQIAGFGDTPQGDRAFLWSRSGRRMTELGTFPNGGGSYALALNDSSHVVGFAMTSAGASHAFLWKNDVLTDLGTLGGEHSVAYGISNAGEVVGYSQVANGEYHAFVWTAQSGMVDLGALPGGSVAYAQSINETGEVAGIALDANGVARAVRWSVVLQ